MKKPRRTLNSTDVVRYGERSLTKVEHTHGAGIHGRQGTIKRKRKSVAVVVVVAVCAGSSKMLRLENSGKITTE